MPPTIPTDENGSKKKCKYHEVDFVDGVCQICYKEYIEWSKTVNFMMFSKTGDKNNDE